MDVSGEVADLLIKEGLQAGEAAVKLAGAGIKHAAALLAALAQAERQSIGRTSAKKLAGDAAPAVVVPLKRRDIPAFARLAKEYGILYVIAQPKGKAGVAVDIVSNERYAAKLNAALQAMGYPIPETHQEERSTKKSAARAPHGSFSTERGHGSKMQTSETKPEKLSVRQKLSALDAIAKGTEKAVPVRDGARER